jgi:hypothetical protein
MTALAPARGCACGLLNLAHIPCSLPRRSLHVTGITFRALRLQAPRRLLRSLCHLSCQRRRLPAHRGSGLRLSIGSSPVGTAESSSCHYGLPVRLPLLTTPSRDDAVSVSYRTETGIPEGDFHLSDDPTYLSLGSHRDGDCEHAPGLGPGVASLAAKLEETRPSSAAVPSCSAGRRKAGVEPSKKSGSLIASLSPSWPALSRPPVAAECHGRWPGQARP